MHAGGSQAVTHQQALTPGVMLSLAPGSVLLLWKPVRHHLWVVEIPFLTWTDQQQ